MYSSGDIIRKAIERKKKKTPSYSIRAFARDLRLSPGFVSKILNGQKPLPHRHVDRVSQVLGFDRATRISLEISTGMVVNRNDVNQTSLPDPNYLQIPEMDYLVLRNWYNIAILDLVTTKDFNPDPKWISARLKINPNQAADALKELERRGLIECRSGRWLKTNKKIRFAAKESKETVRDFHRQMLAKASRQIAAETDRHSYELRSVTGVMVASNPANLEKAKAILEDAMYRAAQVLAEGECTEVYSISSVLLPLTTNPTDPSQKK